MTLIKRNENSPAWPNFFNEFFNHDWADWVNNNYSEVNTTLPSVNIKENEDVFEVEMAVPGMSKEDFKIELNHRFLTISAEKKVEKEEKKKNEKYTRREFCYRSFSRSFTLPEVVEGDKIEAKYDNGLLKVVIPKKEEAKPKPAKLIDIH
jgi:HSP20 family protein